MNGHHRIEVRASGTEGLGIFAACDIEAEDYIHTVAFEREVTEAAPLNEALGERYEHCAYPDGKVMLVAFPARHMNHSCDPNAYYRYDKPAPTAHARRRIHAGEEITVDYLINNPGGDSWPCQCGAARCRGMTGTSFFDLPVRFQREYLPLLAPWFKQRFAEQMAQLESTL